MHDLAVVGAGPAGLAAAVTAAGLGLDVVLVDAGARPGGQYFRHPPEGFRAARPGALHHHWEEFTRLRDAVRTDQRIAHLPGTRVWTVTRPPEGTFTLHTLTGERAPRPGTVDARRLVVATGAYDRVVPFPGWDLPGVLTAGGAQALLKGNLVRAGKRIVAAGTGPFLLPVAAGLAAAGAHVVGVFEANHPGDFARHPGAVLRNAGKLAEGGGYAAALLRHRVPFRTGHAVIAAHGDGAVEAVTVARVDRGWRPVPGTQRVIPCDTLAVGYGFTPQLDLLPRLGCATRTGKDGSAAAVVDAAQHTGVPGVWAAGETTGVGGADLALAEGRLAAHAAAGVRPPARLLRERSRLRAFAAALAEVHAVPDGWTEWLRGDTLICRCEEVPRDRVTAAVAGLGTTDPRTAKLATRAGMGWCQGRMCGYALCALLPDADRAAFADRPLAQPVPLAALASLRDRAAPTEPDGPGTSRDPAGTDARHGPDGPQGPAGPDAPHDPDEAEPQAEE